MFLKIGRQLTGMNNNVCKGVYELLFLFVLTKIKKRVLLLSHIMH